MKSRFELFFAPSAKGLSRLSRAAQTHLRLCGGALGAERRRSMNIIGISGRNGGSSGGGGVCIGETVVVGAAALCRILLSRCCCCSRCCGCCCCGQELGRRANGGDFCSCSGGGDRCGCGRGRPGRGARRHSVVVFAVESENGKKNEERRDSSFLLPRFLFGAKKK